MGTISSWASREGWREERNKITKLARELSDSISFLVDPNTEESAIAQGNLKLLLKIQGIHLAKMNHDMLLGRPMMDIADVVQKYSAALDKLNNTSTRMKNGGIEQREVTHIHIDMDRALELALKAKAAGQTLSVREAAELLSQQQKEVKINAKSD